MPARKRQPDIAGFEDSGHEPLEAGKSKEKHYLLETLERNVVLLTP